MYPDIVTVSKQFSPKPLMHEGQELAFTLEGKHEFHDYGQTHIVQAGDANAIPILTVPT